MQYSTLISQIEADIYSNGMELITGDILQNVLKDMVSALAAAGACYGGAITPASAAPADLDQATVYLATSAGTYTNFVDSNNAPIVTTGPALITFDGGATLVFAKTDLPFATAADLAAKQDTLVSGTNIKTINGENILGPGNTVVGALQIPDPGYWDNDNSGMPFSQFFGHTVQDLLKAGCAVDYEGNYYVVNGSFYGNDDWRLYLVGSYDVNNTIKISGWCVMADTGDVNEPCIDTITILWPETSDCVKFTPQTLTEEQKAQARENIGDGKMGVISQTQTWSGTGSNPRTYVMSNLVTGLIPRANIDLFESAGAVFNESTGYFELNGLTDISYEEMKAIYANTFPDRDVADKAYLYAWFVGVRTNIATSNANRFTGSYLASGQRVNLFYSATSSSIEVYALIVGTSKAICSDLRAFLSGANKIKRVVGAIDLTNTTAYANSFSNAYSLEEIKLAKIGGNISFAQSPLLSKDSLLYMINNAGTATLTITLEGTVYAKCQSGGEWYSDISTALAAHTNISLASA